MTRQISLALSAVTLFALVAAPPAHAGEPTTQLSGAIGRVLKAVEDPELKQDTKAAERRTAVRNIAEDIFDFQETAKRALGPHWQQRSSQERGQFVQAFTDLLESAYLTKIDLYSGEKVSYVGETTEGDQAVVKTRIITRQGSEIPVDYRMHKVGDRWLAYDVIIEGVSLVSNYRAQFNKIIQASSFEGLMEKLRSRRGA
ncbi:MAG: ABC transporter substrate-binding protein [Candidatus Rokubacteria bacterium]|nr:ABC transporter substrate-binding protein [Candidatus Rokubacteria bacterium]